MLISEMIGRLEALKSELGDAEVLGTWEGVVRNINGDNVYAGYELNRWEKEFWRVVFIDCDDNNYKDEFSRKPEGDVWFERRGPVFHAASGAEPRQDR